MEHSTLTSNHAVLTPEPKRSGGPKTPEGKAVSSQNAIKHGLTGQFRIMPEFGETQQKYSELLAALRDEHQPATVTEAFMVQQIAQAMILIERGGLMITGFITPFEPLTMERIQRYITTHTRTVHRSLAELRRLRKDREFVSQNAEAVDSKLLVLPDPKPLTPAPRQRRPSSFRKKPRPLPHRPSRNGRPRLLQSEQSPKFEPNSLPTAKI